MSAPRITKALTADVDGSDDGLYFCEPAFHRPGAISAKNDVRFYMVYSPEGAEGVYLSMHQVKALGKDVSWNKFEEAEGAIKAFRDICKMQHGGHTSPPQAPRVAFNDRTLTQYLASVGLDGVYRKQCAARLAAAASYVPTPPTPPSSPPPSLRTPPPPARRVQPMSGPLSPPVRPPSSQSRSLSTTSAPMRTAPPMSARPTRSAGTGGTRSAHRSSRTVDTAAVTAVESWIDGLSAAMDNTHLVPPTPGGESVALSDIQSAASVDDHNSASYIVVATGAPSTIYASWRHAQRQCKTLQRGGYPDAAVLIAKNGDERDRIIAGIS
ncbi:hypothetical protein BD626DRAFT_578728 [Schizophyllum amplum]|uniref:Uncharacterized protein n=1 Tax=Schizophyllum amplum TaxID=97359 RepID=A0A550BRT9_9AGAR|nr:hypothetical protein BD626DRAFT_578728 [Auriculariopsis ampla]